MISSSGFGSLPNEPWRPLTAHSMPSLRLQVPVPRVLLSSSIQQDSSFHYTKGKPSTTMSLPIQSLVATTCRVSCVPSRYSSLSLSLTCRFIGDGTPLFRPVYTALALLLNSTRFRSPLLPSPHLLPAYPTRMFRFGFLNLFSRFLMVRMRFNLGSLVLSPSMRDSAPS